MIASMVAKYYRFLKEERFPNRMVNIELLLGNHRIWYDLYDFSPPLVDEIDSLDQFPSGYTWDTNGWKSCWHPTIPPWNENWPISGNRATTCKYSTCTCTSLVVSIPSTDHCPLSSFQRFSLRLFRCLLDCQSSIDLLETDNFNDGARYLDIWYGFLF